MVICRSPARGEAGWVNGLTGRVSAVAERVRIADGVGSRRVAEVVNVLAEVRLWLGTPAATVGLEGALGRMSACVRETEGTGTRCEES